MFHVGRRAADNDPWTGPGSDGFSEDLDDVGRKQVRGRSCVVLKSKKTGKIYFRDIAANRIIGRGYET